MTERIQSSYFLKSLKPNVLLHFILRCISHVKKTMKCRVFNYYEIGTDYTRKNVEGATNI